MAFKKGNIPWNKKEKIKKQCLTCNKDFVIAPYRKETAKYCSYKCSQNIWKKGCSTWNKGKKLKYETWQKGKKMSPDFCKKVSEGKKRNYIKENHPMIGKHHSKETRRKISKANKGKLSYWKDKKLHYNVWNKGKKYPQIAGEKNHFWRGGITPLIDLIRGLFENEQWRKKIFERDDYTCQKCHKRGGDLEAHHKKPFKQIFKEFLQYYNQFSPIEDKETLVRLAITYKLFWDLDNGKTLCERCHSTVYYIPLWK